MLVVPLKFMCSTQCETPVRPGGSSFEPTLYQHHTDASGAVCSSRTRTFKPLSRVAERSAGWLTGARCQQLVPRTLELLSGWTSVHYKIVWIRMAEWKDTVNLPRTGFPMKANLPTSEPETLARWAAMNLYGQIRESRKDAPKFVLHDGPPYANGNIHIGTALNKILKDLVTKSQQMLGFDSNYVPGWDGHGLPLEWKVQEENYLSQGKTKPDFRDPAAMVAFRRECRAYANRWLDVQREEFKRLGIIGDWDHRYATMDYFSEAQIARELMKFAANGTLYRGSKPVMWSVVEKTALAEAEVEYEDYTSDTVWVKFPVKRIVGKLDEL